MRDGPLGRGVASEGLVPGHRDPVPSSGEAAELGTRVPHWFGDPRPGAVDLPSLFGRQGERRHVRARPRSSA